VLLPHISGARAYKEYNGGFCVACGFIWLILRMSIALFTPTLDFDHVSKIGVWAHGKMKRGVK